LEQINIVEGIKDDKDKLIVEISPEASPASLNKLLVEQDIYLTHLMSKEKSLEKFFLEITNKNHD